MSAETAVGLEIATAIERAGLSYAVGGMVAGQLWGMTRQTSDVDVTLFESPDRLPELLDTLRLLDAQMDVESIDVSVREELCFCVRVRDVRVDLFFADGHFAHEAERTRVRREIDGGQAWFLSAEAIAVFKLMMFRGKDERDLEQLLIACGAELDRDYVSRNIVGMPDAPQRAAVWATLIEETATGAA